MIKHCRLGADGGTSGFPGIVAALSAARVSLFIIERSVMGLEVTVRVSGNLEQPDLDALRKWLEETYPVEWELMSGPDVDGTLGGTTEVLQAVLEHYAQGMGIGTVTVAADLLREKIRERFERIRDQYPDDDKPELEVETVEQRDESEIGGKTPEQGDADQAE
jgi:hypothetical protein